MLGYRINAKAIVRLLVTTCDNHNGSTHAWAPRLRRLHTLQSSNDIDLIYKCGVIRDDRRGMVFYNMG